MNYTQLYWAVLIKCIHITLHLSKMHTYYFKMHAYYSTCNCMRLFPYVYICMHIYMQLWSYQLVCMHFYDEYIPRISQTHVKMQRSTLRISNCIVNMHTLVIRLTQRMKFVCINTTNLFYDDQNVCIFTMNIFNG